MKLKILSDIENSDKFELDLVEKIDPDGYYIDICTHKEIRNSGIHFTYRGFLNVNVEKDKDGYILSFSFNEESDARLRHMMVFFSLLISIYPETRVV